MSWNTGTGEHFIASNPPSLKSSKDEYNLVIDYAADATGVADSYTAINNALTAVPAAVGGTVYAKRGVYLTSLPFKVYRKTDTVSSIPPSIIGEGAGMDIAGGKHPTTIRASGAFPIGEFMIDYIGSQTTLNSPFSGHKIGGLNVDCQSRAAGIRQVNKESFLLYDALVNAPATPAPADTTGTPTGGVSMVKGSGQDYSYNNVLDKVYVTGAGQDGLHLDESTGSQLTAIGCNGVGSGRYDFYVGDYMECIACDGQSAVTADFYVKAGILIRCHEFFATKGNSIIIDSPFGAGGRSAEVIGGLYKGTSQGALSEQNAAQVVLANTVKARLVGASFYAGTTTSDWLYVVAGITTARLLFDACDFGPDGLVPVTNQFNLNGTSVTKFVNCPGLNPFGTVVVAVPASTVAVAAQPYDRDFYIATGAGATTIAIQGGPTITLQASTAGQHVSVPAQQTMTPTYANPPTWVVEGK